MSSREFWTELTPETRLRNIVMLSAAGSAIAGFVLIIHMPVNVLWRALLILCWFGHCYSELRARARAAARIARIRFDHRGKIHVVGACGKTQPIRLLAGSLVLGRLAWLRFRFEDGSTYAELLRGCALKDSQWHRFQLIWRQTRQLIGGVD